MPRSTADDHFESSYAATGLRRPMSRRSFLLGGLLGGTAATGLTAFEAFASR
ncbi:MAG: hypothetical protein IT336_10035 [Thermomicrobiales bacterium]|nr:hypothetical protein [Thermomicrobiales bacterium]